MSFKNLQTLINAINLTKERYIIAKIYLDKSFDILNPQVNFIRIGK